MFRLLLLLLLRLPAQAQAEPAWPRDPATGQVVFHGQLPWPDSVRTKRQRQVLVRRWYRQKLTNQTYQRLRQTIRGIDTTYAGVPELSCYAHGIIAKEELEYMLCFRVRLVASASSLAYELSDFQVSERGVDFLAIEPVEKILPLPNARVQAVLTAFRKQLRQALQGW